jgi:hypothetical protein
MEEMKMKDQDCQKSDKKALVPLAMPSSAMMVHHMRRTSCVERPCVLTVPVFSI